MRKKLKETTGLLIVSAALALVITLGIVRHDARKPVGTPLSLAVEVHSEEPDPSESLPTTVLEPDVTDEPAPESRLTELNEKSDEFGVQSDGLGVSGEPITDESPLPQYNGQGDSGYTFAEAFADARFRLGPGKVFVWNSMEFTTDLAEEQAADSITGDLASVDSVDLLAKNSPRPE